MTTSFPPLRRHGFTLMELIVVMSIMMLIIGIGFGSFAYFDQEDPFEKPAQRLTTMSKYALNTAVLQHRGMTIRFDKNSFTVLGAEVPDGSQYQLPKGMKVLIKHMGGKGWEDAEGQFWHFGEQGICEPLRVRFESKDGIRDLVFHPLTGGTVD